MATRNAGLVETAPASESTDFQVVGLMIGGEEYALDILNIIGVERLENVLQLPKMPHFIEGVMRIRGEVVPLVRLRSRFGFEERANDRETRVIVVSLATGEGGAPQTVGYIVDSVTSVYRLDRQQIEAAPTMALTVESRFVDGVIRVGERMVILLNPFRVLFDDESEQLQRAAAVARHYVDEA